MPRLIRVLVVAVLAFLVVLPAGQPAAAASQHVITGTVSAAAATERAPSVSPTPSAPAGVNLTPQQAQDKSRQKLVVGLFAAVLLAIVIVGRSSRRKRKKKAEAATSK